MDRGKGRKIELKKGVEAGNEVGKVEGGGKVG